MIIRLLTSLNVAETKMISWLSRGQSRKQQLWQHAHRQSDL